ncbi:putative FmdB family regulatory protein [Cryobacterium sp. MP_3.1]|uniref:FmdB family zinc ribbon protein n=1 Tax=Cryobacterium sp. MP_3.1 TaxID=3071711 RepID=UPI002DFEC5E3|nr:putative FmdB family regulatory protein [Cryobacterium sp. MP_3.1]
MPTYSYRCTECDTAFDIQQAFTDNTLTECPACGGKLRKVYSSIGVSFTGSGFYRNDSRAESGGKSSLSAEKGAKKTDSSSSESSSAKPAEKSSTPAASTSGSSSSGSGSSSSSSSTPTPAPKAS